LSFSSHWLIEGFDFKVLPKNPAQIFSGAAVSAFLREMLFFEFRKNLEACLNCRREHAAEVLRIRFYLGFLGFRDLFGENKIVMQKIFP